MGENGIFILKTAEYLTQEAVKKFNIPIIPKGSVILSFKMTLGRVGIASNNMLSNEAIAHFKLNKDSQIITKEFLYLFLKSFNYDTLGSTSSIVTAINSTMIKEIIVKIPNNTIRDKFQSQVETYFDKIYENSKQILKLEQMRDIILPRLLSGEVRV